MQQLFRGSVKDFDVVIELEKKSIPKLPFVQTMTLNKSTIKLCSSIADDVTNDVIPVVDFDPVNLYIEQLQVLLFPNILKINMGGCWVLTMEG